jgi:hypothetical protein
MKELFAIFLAIWHARRIQDYFWNKPGKRVDENFSASSYEDWIRTLEKRIALLRKVNPDNPHWKVEARKRALQVAGVGIAMITAINNNSIKPELK